MSAQTQSEVTRRLHGVTSRIRKLDAVFGSGDHANWWNAFKRGPIEYWLTYYFGNDEVGLWEAIHSRIADILDARLLTAAQRTAEIRKQIMELEAELKAAKLKQTVQDQVNDTLQNLASRKREMPPRLVKKRDNQRSKDRGKTESAFVDACV